MPLCTRNGGVPPRFMWHKGARSCRRGQQTFSRFRLASPPSNSFRPAQAVPPMSPRRPATKAPENRRSVMVHLRMTAEEHATAKAVATRLGIPVSRLLRSRAEALPPSKTDLAVAAEFTRIGSNINQIAHVLNGGDHPELDSIMPILEQLHGELAELRHTLRGGGE